MTFFLKNKLFLSIALIIFISLSPLTIFSSTKAFYFNRFEEYNVYQNFSNYPKFELDKNFEDIIDYTNQKDIKLDPQFFSKEDLIHMHDVRIAISYMYITIGLAFTFILIHLLKLNISHNFLKSVKYASVITLTIFLSLLVIGLVSFNTFFIKFHEVIFPNDYWLLDPTTSNLIKYLPINIFQDLFILYIGSLLILCPVLILFSRNILAKESR